MVSPPSLGICLYGTEEMPPESRELAVGPLSAILQSGALRAVSLGGREAIRGIAFVVRDENWGTCIPRIAGMEIADSDDGIRISYDAECVNGRQVLAYTAVIEASSEGCLSFSVKGAARSAFSTNRTGFVVLHPLDGVTGHPVTVTHTDGSVDEAVFPGAIQPAQPFLDIRALTHSVSRDSSVTCILEGDACEMEDQRNWTDASYKTYMRPLARPWPYTLDAGTEFRQRVRLGVEGTTPSRTWDDNDRVDTISIREDAAGRVPELMLAVHPDYAKATLDVADHVRRTKVSYVVCTFDVSAGHRSDTMEQFRRISEETGARLVLEAVLPLRDGHGRFTADPGVLEADVAAVQQAADDAGVAFAAVAASAACYHKSYQPTGEWPDSPPLAAVYAAVRSAFPEALIAGGMHSYFTELNRFPPPIDAIDIITHTTCPIVHAADDISVMQSLQSLPWIFKTAQTLGHGKRYWIGPTALGMRLNPYGASPAPNPRNIRKAMAESDPRQRGLFNAAWTLGYITRAAAGGVTGLCLSSPVGPFGIAWQPMDWSQPWFDEQASAKRVFPVYHVIAGVAPSAGAVVRAVDCPEPSALAAIAVDSRDGRQVWLANLTPEPRVANLQGLGPTSVIERLDAETFTACCSAPDGFASTATVATLSGVPLGPYAVLRISQR